MSKKTVSKKWPAVLASMMLASVLAVGVCACVGSNSSGASGSPNASASAARPANGVAISTADLVGKWVEVSVDSYYVFNADGTGEQSHYGKTAHLPAWRVENNHLYLEIANSTPEDFDVELNASKDTLIIHNPAIDFTYKKSA